MRKGGKVWENKMSLGAQQERKATVNKREGEKKYIAVSNV